MCFCCVLSAYSPPLEKGGQGGLKGIASTLGRCDNSAEDSSPGTAHEAVVTRGYPPAPPSERGGRRNGRWMKSRLLQDELFITRAKSNR